MYEKKFIDNLFKLYIDNRYGHRDFRPQAVLILYNENKKILLSLNKQHHVWAPPQEGIERGETLESAFIRCLAEELYSIYPNDMSLVERHNILDCYH